MLASLYLENSDLGEVYSRIFFLTHCISLFSTIIKHQQKQKEKQKWNSPTDWVP